MSVQQQDVIDFVAHHPKTGQLALVMVETRDWKSAPEAIHQLQTKFLLYAETIMSGAVTRQHPGLANSQVRIRLDHFSPIPVEVEKILRLWAGRLSGVPVIVCSHRLYWNPIIRFTRSFVGRFRGPNWGVLEWSAEPRLAEALLTRQQFADEFCATVSRQNPGWQVDIVKGLEIKVTAPEGKEFKGFLDNAYRHYQVAPENKDEIIKKYVTGLLETADVMEAGIDKTRIVPVLKDKAWQKQVNAGLKAAGESKTFDNVFEPYNEELVIAYAEDSPNNVRYLTSSDLAELKLEPKDLRSLACQNLQNLLPEPKVQQVGECYRISANGDYDASLLLIEDLWSSGKIQVEGEVIAVIPSRDFLMVTGSYSAGGLKKLKMAAQAAAAQAPYPITSKLFVRRGEHFEVFA